MKRVANCSLAREHTLIVHLHKLFLSTSNKLTKLFSSSQQLLLLRGAILHRPAQQCLALLALSNHSLTARFLTATRLHLAVDPIEQLVLTLQVQFDRQLLCVLDGNLTGDSLTQRSVFFHVSGVQLEATVRGLLNLQASVLLGGFELGDVVLQARHFVLLNSN